MRPIFRFLSIILPVFFILLCLSVLHGPTQITRATGPVFSDNSSLTMGTPCATWKVVVSPNIANRSNSLAAVTALSSSNAWAVGSYQDASGVLALTLIEHWDGLQWTIIPSPNLTGARYNYLTSVTALSSSSIWAVGYSLFTPSIGSSYDQTLVEHWNGKKWVLVKSPNPGVYTDILTSVTAVSGKNVWAVGYYQNPIINDGGNTHTLVLHWDGLSWSVVKSLDDGTNGSVLTSSTAISATDIWAVGYFFTQIEQTLIEHWDGTTWNIITSPNVGASHNTLQGVTSLSATNIWAVGSFQTVTNSPNLSLAERWSGTSWSIMPNPVSPGSNGTVINAVTALSAKSIWIVGYFDNVKSGTSNYDQTLVEYWNGSMWSHISSPNVGKLHNRLVGVAHIPGTNQVWSVGFTLTQAGYKTLIEHCV